MPTSSSPNNSHEVDPDDAEVRGRAGEGEELAEDDLVDEDLVEDDARDHTLARLDDDDLAYMQGPDA